MALSTLVAAAAVIVSADLGLDAAHRALAAFAGAPAVALVVSALWWHPRLRRAAIGTLALLLATAASGGLLAAHGPSTTLRAAHVVLAALAFAAAAVTALRVGVRNVGGAGGVRDHITLTKPRIMSLLLVTGACGMVIADRGVPGAGRFAAAMSGLALACGGASALNHVLDRDLDRQMERTAGRPVASGRLSPSRAAEYGVALSACSFVLLTATVNLLTAALALAGNLFYVIVYTGLLKRRTAQNIVIGGAAGAMPPLVGWAAATGDLNLAALLLFATVFLWTPPHFWALALLVKDDYGRAGVPMLPVTAGVDRTARSVLRYSLVLVACTLALGVIDQLGWAYLAPAGMSGATFVALAAMLHRQPTSIRAARLFRFSLAYLAIVFAAAALAVV
jgi:heme o synthase